MTTAGPGVDELRHGFRYWWAGFLAMVRWEVTGMRLLLPLTIFVQLVLGAGFILGMGLFFAEIPARAALFLSTGASVLTLVTVGLVLGPQLVAQQKMSGTYEFVWSLPVPRTAQTAAWVALNLIIALPGMIVALLTAVWRYGVDLDIAPSIVPAVLATLITAALLGTALAHAVPNPQLIALVTQLVIFVILGFAPVNFPPENLPGWLANLNEYLPFLPMATVVRGGLTQGLVSGVGHAYAVLAVWAAMGTGFSAWALGRRR